MQVDRRIGQAGRQVDRRQAGRQVDQMLGRAGKQEGSACKQLAGR